MGDPATPAHGTVRWTGELLWPQDLSDGEVIDLSDVVAVGTWVHLWFIAHPGRGVIRASPMVRRQLLRAGVPVVWVDPMAPATTTGVGPGERAALLGES